MMSFSELVSSPLKRLYTLILKKLIGDYLKDELHQSQLEVKLSEGFLEIKDIELDVEVLNEAVEGLPFEIKKAVAGRIRAIIPWHSLKKENCKVTVKGLNMVVERLHDDCDTSQQLTESFLREASRAAIQEEDMNAFVRKYLKQNKKGKKEEKNASIDEESKSTKGKQVIADGLRKVLSRTEFFAEDSTFRFQFYHSDLKTPSELILRVSEAQYVNVGTEAKNGTDALLEKVVKLRGMKIELSTPKHQKQQSITVAHTDVAKFSEFKFTLSQRDGAMRMDADGQIDAVRMMIGPRQLKQLSDVLKDIQKSLSMVKKHSEDSFDDASTEVDELMEESKRMRNNPAASYFQKPLGAADMKTVESLLAKDSSSMVDSFASATSDASLEFFDCNSGSMMTTNAEAKESPMGHSSTTLTGSIPRAKKKRKKKDISWSMSCSIKRLALIVLEDDVDQSRWPQGNSWYLSPIPLPDLGGVDYEKMHPAPAILGLGVNHYVGYLDKVDALMERISSKPRTEVSFHRVKILEYFKDSSKIGGFSTSYGIYHCLPVLKFNCSSRQEDLKRHFSNLSGCSSASSSIYETKTTEAKMGFTGLQDVDLSDEKDIKVNNKSIKWNIQKASDTLSPDVRLLIHEASNSKKKNSSKVKEILRELKWNSPGKHEPSSKVELQMLAVKIQLDFGALRRLQIFQEKFEEKVSNSTFSEPEFQRCESKTTSNDMGSSISSSEPIQDQDAFQEEQVRIYPPPDSISRHSTSTRIEISAPSFQLLFSSSKEYHSCLEVNVNDLTATNAPEQSIENSDRNSLLNIKASNMTVYLLGSPSSQGNRQRSRSTYPLVEIENPHLFVIPRSEDMSSTVIFHPFLAPGTKITARETETFFQRLWDPYRVWESDAKYGGQQRAKYDRSTKKRSRREPKTLREFEKSCQRQAVLSLSGGCRKCTIVMSKQQFSRLDNFLKEFSLSFKKTQELTERKAEKADSKLDEKLRQSKSISDSGILPQPPEHIPHPSPAPTIPLPIPRRRIHSAFHHQLAIDVNIKMLVIELEHHASDSKIKCRTIPRKFRLIAQRFRLFHLHKFNHQDTNYSSIDLDHVQLLATSPGNAPTVQSVVFNTLSDDRSGRAPRNDNHILQLVHVTSKSKLNDAQQNKIALNLNTVTFEIPKLELCEQWVKGITEIFDTSSDIPRSGSKLFNTENSNKNRSTVSSPQFFLYLHAADCAIDYNPPTTSSRGVLLFTRISTRMCDLEDRTSTHITVDLSDLRFYVIPKSVKAKPTLVPLGTISSILENEGERKSNGTEMNGPCPHLFNLGDGSLIQYLERTGFARVASIDGFHMFVQILPKSVERRESVLKRNPLLADTTIELTRGALSVDVCADSCAVLTALSAQIMKELTPLETPKEFEVSFKKKGSLLGDIDQQAFNPVHKPVSVVKTEEDCKKEDIKEESLTSRLKFKDYFQKDRKGISALESKLVSSRETREGYSTAWKEPFQIVENHFVFVSETDRIYKDKGLHAPRTYPRPKLTFKMHSVRAQIGLYDGHDFMHGKKSLEKRKEANSLDKKTMYSINSAKSVDSSEGTSSTVFGFHEMKRKPKLQTISIQPMNQIMKAQGLDAFVQDTYMERTPSSRPTRTAPRQPLVKEKEIKISSSSGTKPLTLKPRSNEGIKADAQGIHLIFNSYTSSSREASYFALAIDDINVHDKVTSSDFKSVLSYDKPKKSLRESGSSMVKVKSTNVRPDPERNPDRQESRFYVNLLPIRLKLDQDTLEFAQKFQKNLSAANEISKQLTAVESQQSVKSVHLPDDEEKVPPQVYIQSFRVEDFQICVDYRPKRIDLDALRAGEYAELAHLLRLEEVRIVLPKKFLRAIEGWDGLGSRLGKEWADEILGKQLHRCLAGIQPLRSLVKVGSGVADWVSIPLEQFKKDGGVLIESLRGLRQVMFSYVKSKMEKGSRNIEGKKSGNDLKEVTEAGDT